MGLFFFMCRTDSDDYYCLILLYNKMTEILKVKRRGFVNCATSLCLHYVISASFLYLLFWCLSCNVFTFEIKSRIVIMQVCVFC